MLDQTPGVQHYQVQHSYSMNLVSVQEGDTTLTLDDLRARLLLPSDDLNTFGAIRRGAGRSAEIAAIRAGQCRRGGLNGAAGTQFQRGTRSSRPPMQAKPVMVIGDNRFVTAAGIGVGDKLTFAMNSGDGQSAASGDAANRDL